MFAAVALTFAAGPLSAQPAGKPVAKFTLPGLWQEFIQNQVGFEERDGGKLIEVSGPVEKVRRIDKATGKSCWSSTAAACTRSRAASAKAPSWAIWASGRPSPSAACSASAATA